MRKFEPSLPEAHRQTPIRGKCRVDEQHSPKQKAHYAMEQRHNSAALISTALLFVVVVMLYSVPALTAHGFVPKASLLGDTLWMHAAGIVSVLGFIQCWRIGGGLDDFVLGSSFSFSAEDLKEHGFMLPIFVAVASNSFFIAVLVSLLMLVFGAE